MENNGGSGSGIGSEEAKGPFDVFLCFCDETRYSFTGTLHDALKSARLKSYMESGKLRRGDRIATAILTAMEASRISIVVFSQDFASSTCCLDQLVHIHHCINTNNQLILPIFYDVDQSDVRDQRNTFGQAMLKHENRFGKSSDKVLQWRSVLSHIANFTSRCFKSTGDQYEYQFVEEIVDWVIKTGPRKDVFLSFCGKDTKYSFTGFLYNALSQSGFKTFMNNDGDQISQSTIEKSRLSIIVFSKNYAHSSSCLDELLTILDCMKMKNQLVCPIFYKVEPSDIRHQINSYGEAMTEHENMLGQDSEKVQKWRSALYEAANLKGWPLKTGDQYEYEVIEKIVEMAIKI